MNVNKIYTTALILLLSLNVVADNKQSPVTINGSDNNISIGNVNNHQSGNQHLSKKDVSIKDNLDAQERAMKMIASFSKEICGDIPIKGSNKNIDISSKAKANLNGMIKKIADLGIDAAAKYQNSEYNGLLQSDLLKGISETKDCKLKVFTELKIKLIDSVN